MGRPLETLTIEYLKSGQVFSTKMEVHLGFWLQVFLKAEIIQNCLGSMRLEHIRKTHPQLWRHPAAPLTCFKRGTSHACKILQNIKTLKTSRDCSMAVAAMELQQATLWYQVGCFLSFDKPSKLKG